MYIARPITHVLVIVTLSTWHCNYPTPPPPHTSAHTVHAWPSCELRPPLPWLAQSQLLHDAKHVLLIMPQLVT